MHVCSLGRGGREGRYVVASDFVGKGDRRNLAISRDACGIGSHDKYHRINEV